MLTLKSVAFGCFHYYLCHGRLAVSSPPRANGKLKAVWKWQASFGDEEHALVVGEVKADVTARTCGSFIMNKCMK